MVVAIIFSPTVYKYREIVLKAKDAAKDTPQDTAKATLYTGKDVSVKTSNTALTRADVNTNEAAIAVNAADIDTLEVYMFR